MSQQASPGSIFDLSDVSDFSDHKPHVVVKCDAFTVLRLVLASGASIPEHKAPKEITVQCVLGEVEFSTMDKKLTLKQGQLLYLLPGEMHSLVAVQDSIVLVTKAN